MGGDSGWYSQSSCGNGGGSYVHKIMEVIRPLACWQKQTCMLSRRMASNRHLLRQNLLDTTLVLKITLNIK